MIGDPPPVDASSLMDGMKSFQDEEMLDHSVDSKEATLISKSGLPLNSLRTELLDYLANSSKAHFKSQQMNDPELPYASKRLIAEQLLDRSPAQFLGRYGECMQEHHLQYFLGDSELLQQESYEIRFHLKQLKRFHCKATHDVDIKNRRYDAMKKMIADGSSYFTEDEMRQRNPYLYEQLVGQYLSEEERREREIPDLANITFVNLLLTKISRDETIELKKKQERDENGSEDNSSAEDTDKESDSEVNQHEREGGTWGETPEKISKIMESRKKKRKQKSKAAKMPQTTVEISDEERILLMDEFVSTMYNSFIDGNDKEFDYSQVDSNPDFDCIDVRERDEEEKYFDEDSVEDNVMEVTEACQSGKDLMPLSLKEKMKREEEEEDALDAFMKTIAPSAPTSDLTHSFQKLCQQSSTQPAEQSRVVKKHVIKININKD